MPPQAPPPEAPPPPRVAVRGYHRRVAARDWNAVPGARFLGASLALHAMGAGLLAAGVLSALAAREGREPRPVASELRVARVDRPEVRLAVEEERESEPEIEVEPLLDVEDPEEPSEPAEEPPEEPAESDDDLLEGRVPLEAEFGPLVVPAAPAPRPELAPPPSRPSVSEAPAAAEEPLFLEKPQPPYPIRARRNGWEGRVDCLLVVEPDGRISEVRVLRSSGYPVLDEAARDTIAGSWRLRPIPGARTAIELEHSVEFVLEERFERR